MKLVVRDDFQLYIYIIHHHLSSRIFFLSIIGLSTYKFSSFRLVFYFSVRPSFLKKIPMPLISVIGNIGAGKSTLCRMLKTTGEYDVYLEPLYTDVYGENMLKLMYNDPEKNGFMFQTCVLGSYIRLYREISEKSVFGESINVIERSHLDGLNVFVPLINMSSAEKAALKHLSDCVSTMYPDAFVYVRTPYSACFRNTFVRGNSEESRVDLPYLRACESKYDAFADSLRAKNIPVLEYDYRKEEDGMRKVKEFIERVSDVSCYL